MKKQITRIFSLLLVLVLCFTCAACGGDTNSTPNTNNDDFFTDTQNIISTESETQGDATVPSNQTGTSTSGSTSSVPQNNVVKGKSLAEVLKSIPKDLKGTTIEVANWNPISEYAGAEEAIKKFESLTGIKVKWTVIEYSVYFSKISSRIAVDDAPDVCRTRTPNVVVLQNFQPLSVTGYDFSDEAWDSTLMKNYTINNNAYATSLAGTHINSATMMFYNKSLILKYNLDDPYKLWKNGKWTWDKFISLSEEFIKASKSEWAVTSSNYDPWLPSFGVQGPVEFDGAKYKSIIKTDKYIDAMQTITDMHTGTKILKHWDTSGFENGNGLFFVGDSVYARRRNSYFASLKKDGLLEVVPMPSHGDAYYQGMGEYEAYAVAKGAKNPKAVPYFLRYFLDPANYDMNSFFMSTQALEVSNWCMEQKNIKWPTYNGGIADYKDTFGDIFNKPSDQVKTFIDSNSSVIDTRVKTYNNIINSKF